MNVTLRDCTVDDLELLLAWRNLCKDGFHTQGQKGRFLSWEEHWTWWKANQDGWVRFIIQVNDGHWTRDVGAVSFRDMYAWNPEVGIYIGEVMLWGQGVGKQGLRMALDWLKEQGKQYCRTTIDKGNERAIRLFEGLGFKRLGEGREDEWMYLVKL